jgi:predicted ATP-dependent serine protease
MVEVKLVEALGTSELDFGRIESCDPDLVIVDSLPAFAGRGKGADERAFSALRDMKQFVSENSCVSIILNHINKRREASGPMAWQHEVDCTLSLFPRSQMMGETERKLIAVKNRYGATDRTTLRLTMSDCGLEPIVTESENESENKTTES